MFGFGERDRQKGVFIRRRVARGKPLEAKKWTLGYETRVTLIGSDFVRNSYG